ncbi:hypothetical protein N7474_000434 [Penicillium riverlandense]|uniref:uncharacterized protein n=1 Tax=Penicillium riverlandense TaxID=1903569 RepID=UPI0025490258|nr:uncharacterized protein N7474_000434 [Penicillium riverlandense]KAJ5832123.1 hypothetical protein N7474_000434 [Penicillium riverlandense]
MWFYRGAQSAVFYYVTCTPCASSFDRRKRKKDAARSQRLKDKYSDHHTHLVSDQPRPFPQPTPFSTNDGWRDEIALGPGPPARRGGQRNNVRRADSWNTDQENQDSLTKKDRSGSLMHPLGERWNNWMRYQREDEPLWGQEVQGSSIGFSGRGRADPNESSKYYIARVPPVNDLHPPIVSGPRNRAETRWMLQPPPTARVMAGKERFNLAASDNIGDDKRYPRLIQENVDPNEKSAVRSSNEAGDGAFDGSYLLRRPSMTRLKSESALYDDHHTTLHYRSDSMFSMANSDGHSPTVSWNHPDTPDTRPNSKATDDSGKLPRQQISKTLSTLQRDNKKIHMLQVEISDDARDDVELGQLERIRPWRWSMDI